MAASTLPISEWPAAVTQRSSARYRHWPFRCCSSPVSDEGYRRLIGAQLNVTEARHRFARKIFFGQRGELRQHYREGMEDQLGALGLALNAVVLFNTLYIDAAVKQLAADGFPVTDDLIARLSPLQYDHINFLGRYAFTSPRPTARPPPGWTWSPGCCSRRPRPQLSPTADADSPPHQPESETCSGLHGPFLPYSGRTSSYGQRQGAPRFMRSYPARCL